MTKFFGGLLMAIGILIAALSGLCSAWYLIIILTSPPGGSELGNALSMLIPVGILPCLIGVGLFFWGRALVRGM